MKSIVIGIMPQEQIRERIYAYRGRKIQTTGPTQRIGTR